MEMLVALRGPMSRCWRAALLFWWVLWGLPRVRPAPPCSAVLPRLLAGLCFCP